VAGFQERFAARNPAFLRALAHPDRPWILLKWAASVDGRTAAASGASRWISGPAAREEVHRLRALADAILVGPRTLLEDDPALTARPGGVPAVHQPLRVVLLPEGVLPAGARVLREPGPRLWLLAEGAEPCAALSAALVAAGDRACCLPPGPGGRLDLGAACHRLRAEHGVRRLFVEGGAGLHGALADAGLVDAVLRYEAPLLMGGGRGAVEGRGAPDPRRALSLGQEERCDLGPDLRRALLVLEAAP